MRRHYRFACGTCGDRTWVIRPGYGAWLISCSNGHQLVPSGGTEFVIEDPDEGMREMQRGDQQGSTHGGHPSGAQADRDTSVLSETEARERADGGSDRGQGGEDGRTVTVDVQIWEEMNYKYLDALRDRDSARAEVQKQRERANRSQNEASARVSELRSLNHRYEAMQARAERLEGELARARAEFDDNNAILEDTINRQAARIKELIETESTVVSRPEVEGLEGLRRKLGALDKVHNLIHPLVEALEELMLDE